MWVSPDGKIHKLVLVEGEWGTKPSEQTECEILISDCPESFSEYNNSIVVIGNSDTYIARMLDICLSTMNQQETAKFKLIPDSTTFTIQLKRIHHNGYIYQWSAKQKLEIAQNHKEKGVILYKQSREKDAAYRFSKALKIIHSIPIDVEQPEGIDGIPLNEINKLKANLYNNLASFYMKKGAWLLTIDVCKKVLSYESDNVKAHYKLAVAYFNDKNFEFARNELHVVFAVEPENKAALELMKKVNHELQVAEAKFNQIVKKMFV